MKRIVIAVLLLLTTTTFMFAQAPTQRGQRGGPGGPGDPLARFKSALNLTDAQVTAIQSLMQTRRTRAQAIMTDIRAKRQALDAALNATTPNPTDVGNAAIALHASEKILAGEQDWFISELKKLLTGDQQQKLDTLLAASPGGGMFFGGMPGPGPRGMGRGQGPGPRQ